MPNKFPQKWMPDIRSLASGDCKYDRFTGQFKSTEGIWVISYFDISRDILSVHTPSFWDGNGLSRGFIIKIFIEYLEFIESWAKTLLYSVEFAHIQYDIVSCVLIERGYKESIDDLMWDKRFQKNMS